MQQTTLLQQLLHWCHFSFHHQAPTRSFVRKPRLHQEMRSGLPRSAQAHIAEKESTLTTGLVIVLRQQPRIAALQHVVHALDELVDVSCQWDIAQACALENDGSTGADGGAERLVHRIVARRPLAEMDLFYRQAQLSAGLVNASQCGNVGLVRWLLENISCDRVTLDSNSGVVKAVKAAASNGHIRVLEDLLSRDKRGVSIQPAMLCAARDNKLAVLQWLHKRLALPDGLKTIAAKLLELAACNGNVRMAEWVVGAAGRECMVESVSQAVQSALSGGHLEMVKQLMSATSTETKLSLDEAAGNGHLLSVQWGHANGGVCTTEAMDTAAHHGHLEVVKWLHKHRTEGCTSRAIDNAASHGHLVVVQWLHANRVEGCTNEAMDKAASHGHLEVVEWLHKHRTEGCTVKAMDKAARNNHVDMMQWLHDNRMEGCTQAALDDAAGSGGVNTLQWLITHRPDNCCYTRRALENAAASGHLRIVQQIYECFQNSEQGSPQWFACEAMNRAASGGHLHVVQWLHERRPEVGSCTTAAMDCAASNGHLKVVKWLQFNRPEGATYRAMDGAAAGGHLDVLVFLYSHRKDGCTSAAAVKAALNEHVEVVQWLLQRYPQQICHERVRKFAARYNFSLLDQFHRNQILPVGVH